MPRRPLDWLYIRFPANDVQIRCVMARDVLLLVASDVARAVGYERSGAPMVTQRWRCTPYVPREGFAVKTGNPHRTWRMLTVPLALEACERSRAPHARAFAVWIRDIERTL